MQLLFKKLVDEKKVHSLFDTSQSVKFAGTSIDGGYDTKIISDPSAVLTFLSPILKLELFCLPPQWRSTTHELLNALFVPPTNFRVIPDALQNEGNMKFYSCFVHVRW